MAWADMSPQQQAMLMQMVGGPGQQGMAIPGAPPALTPQQLLMQQGQQAQGQYALQNPQTSAAQNYINALMQQRGGMAGGTPQGFGMQNPGMLMHLLGGGGQGISMADRLRMMMGAGGF